MERNEVPATQSTQTLNPDKQNELMEIVRRKSEEFEHQASSSMKSDNNGPPKSGDSDRLVSSVIITSFLN